MIKINIINKIFYLLLFLSSYPSRDFQKVLRIFKYDKIIKSNMADIDTKGSCTSYEVNYKIVMFII